MKVFLLETYLKFRSFLLLPLLAVRSEKEPLACEIKKIAVLRHDRIGDMVVSTAMFKALKCVYPQAEIIVLASRANRDVIVHNPYIKHILIYTTFSNSRKALKDYKPDLVIDGFHTYQLKTALLAYFSGARYRKGFAIAGREAFFNTKGCAVVLKQSMCRQLTLLSGVSKMQQNLQPEIFLTPQESIWAAEVFSSKGLTGGFKIAFHLGAHFASQKWGTEKFILLAQRIISEYGKKIIVFCSEAETDCSSKIMRSLDKKNAVLLRCATLRQFIALLNHCDLLVCNNSGPLHIAAALNIATVSTLGPSDAIMWYPTGKNHIVIKGDCTHNPCGRAHCAKQTCMKNISDDEMFEAVRTQVNKITYRNCQEQNCESRYRKKHIFSCVK